MIVNADNFQVFLTDKRKQDYTRRTKHKNSRFSWITVRGT